MALTPAAFANYLRTNEGAPQQLSKGTVYTFQLQESRSLSFRFSIRFFSNKWSQTTKRGASGKRIAEFLAIFNRNPDGGLEQYRNRGGKGSQAWVANYLVPLMQAAQAQTTPVITG